MAENIFSSVSVTDLKHPECYSSDSENICIDHACNSSVFIGNENGCFFVDVESGSLQKIAFTDQVTSICHETNANDNEVYYLASYKSLYRIDIRESLSPKLLFNENHDDEINQIKFKSSHIAACDDMGECRIYDLQAGKLFRTLRRKHTNICSSIVYHPSKSDVIFSGGLDSQLISWDFRKVKVISCFDMQTVLQQLGDDSVYMFNPPHVHSIDIADSENYLACGLGNGSIQIFKVVNKSRQLLFPSMLINHHASVGVSSVGFAKFYQQEDLLLTGGNDGVVNLWSLPKQPLTKKKTVNTVATEDDVKSFLLKSQKFESKINFITTGVIDDLKVMFVADQSPSVKMVKFG